MAAALLSSIGSGAMADPTAAPTVGPTPLARQSGYECYIGGFCGSEGWGYGDYRNDTPHSSGCAADADGRKKWDQGVSHVPLLPEYATEHCSFFYGVQVCSLPTVICHN